MVGEGEVEHYTDVTLKQERPLHKRRQAIEVGTHIEMHTHTVMILLPSTSVSTSLVGSSPFGVVCSKIQEESVEYRSA
jgi:hypothetical protein